MRIFAALTLLLLFAGPALADPAARPAPSGPSAPTGAPAPSGSAAVGQGAIEDLWKRGEEARRSGDLDAALAAFSAALAADERRARSWNYVGGVHFARGEWAKALEMFLKAVELDPADVRAWNNAGTASERGGDCARAEIYYRRAANADPVYALTHRNLGIIYARCLNRPADARRAWQRYLELAPPGPRADDIRRELMLLPDNPSAAPPAPWPPPGAAPAAPPASH